MAAKRPGAAAPLRAFIAPALDLSRAREKQGISLEHIAERTKIGLRFLRAIEAEDFDQLPGGIFNISYLRQYAAASGFDEMSLMDCYRRHTAPPERPEPLPAPKRAARGFFDRWFRIPAEARH